NPLLAQSVIYYDGAISYTTAPTFGLGTKTFSWVSNLGTSNPSSPSASAYVSKQSDYDTNGNITATYDAFFNKSSLFYDSRGNITKVTNALNQSTVTAYDTLDRATQMTDAN